MCVFIGQDKLPSIPSKFPLFHLYPITPRATGANADTGCPGSLSWEPQTESPFAMAGRSLGMTIVVVALLSFLSLQCAGIICGCILWLQLGIGQWKQHLTLSPQELLGRAGSPPWVCFASPAGPGTWTIEPPYTSWTAASLFLRHFLLFRSIAGIAVKTCNVRNPTLG